MNIKCVQNYSTEKNFANRGPPTKSTSYPEPCVKISCQSHYCRWAASPTSSRWRTKKTGFRRWRNRKLSTSVKSASSVQDAGTRRVSADGVIPECCWSSSTSPISIQEGSLYGDGSCKSLLWPNRDDGFWRTCNTGTFGPIVCFWHGRPWHSVDTSVSIVWGAWRRHELDAQLSVGPHPYREIWRH